MTIMGRTGNTTGLVKTVAMAVLIAWQSPTPRCSGSHVDPGVDSLDGSLNCETQFA
jgi:hypothetical protein